MIKKLINEIIILINHYTKFYLKELNKFNSEIFIVIKLINFISQIMDNEIERNNCTFLKALRATPQYKSGGGLIRVTL